MTDRLRVLVGEALGTMFLVATVIGSGVMAEQMAGGNNAVALLGNTAATAAVLYVLITTLGPISGAQFNPVVTLLLSKGRARWMIIAIQFAAAIVGTILAHAMFGHPLIETGIKARTGPAIWLGEFVATFGLLMTIQLGARYRADAQFRQSGRHIGARADGQFCRYTIDRRSRLRHCADRRRCFGLYD
jgi:glycerol uptake facilitator-like aquaporin